MRPFMPLFMLSCRRASYLVDKRSEGELSPLESLSLRLHLSMCRACRRYDRHGRDLETLLAGEKEGLPEVRLDRESKERIKRKLGERKES